MAFAHAPYSKFPVGAAIRAEDGRIYTGANIENLSFPQGWCAEPTAISLMIMGGAKKIVEMAVIAEKRLLEERLVKKGDVIGIVAGTPMGLRGTTNFMKFHVIGGLS